MQGKLEEELRQFRDEIVVNGAPIKGEVIAPQPPVLVLDEKDIEAYGAASIDELITILAPEIGSGRGRGSGGPVFLLNGQRISSFREMRDIPPEAIKRLEILPEEVALRFGYAPDQRVVNIILKDHFQSKSLLGQDFASFHGGTSSPGAVATLAKINGPRRATLTASYHGDTLLTEDERNLRQQFGTEPTVASDPDPAHYRSLVPSDQKYELNGNWSTGLGNKGLGGSLSFNADYIHEDTKSLSGLDTVTLTDPVGATAIRTLPDPLARAVSTDTVQFGSTLNEPLGGWQLSATLDSSYVETESRIDRRRGQTALQPLIDAALAGTLPITGPLPSVAAPGRDFARERDIALTSLVTLVGSPVRLPAGKATLTVKLGYAYSNTDSSDTRSAQPAMTLDRSDASALVNLALPLTSRREHVLGAVGDLTLNLSAGYNRLSAFGSLTDASAGLTWNVTDKLGLQASYILNDTAPTLTQLGAPTALTLNVPVYDFVQSRTVNVTALSGGNPLLAKEREHDIKLGLNWKLPFFQRSNLIVEYFRNRSNDVTAAFPLLTPVIEAAFPGRAVRDSTGQLIQIDQRPVTFSQQLESRLRWGFNLSGRIAPSAASQAKAETSAAAVPGGLGLGGPPQGGGRWNMSLYHTYQFTDRITIVPGGPVLDLLNGDALTSGGVARHSLTFEGGGFYDGFGLRLNGTWSAPVHVDATGAPASSALRFGSVLNVAAWMFVDFERTGIAQHAAFLKGARMTLKIDDILDSRQRVTDSTGQVPIAYQADYLDPRGRTFGIAFRKMF